MSQAAILENLKHKVARLIADNRLLRSRNETLVRDVEKLKVLKMELQTRIVEQERRINVLELSQSMHGNTQDKQLAKARVNRLMREVDRCIALINK